MAEVSFEFFSEAANGNDFTVVGFEATEGISKLYEYRIELKALDNVAIDHQEMLRSAARFITITEDATGIPKEHPVYGVLATFEEHHTAQNYTYYRTVLVPRLWRLSTFRTNEIYTVPEPGQTIVNIIDQVLSGANFGSSDYDITGLTGNFLEREYICQFGESYFNFISRLMENEGVFFYFEQDEIEEVEKIIFIDSLLYDPLEKPKVPFNDTTILADKTVGGRIYEWVCRSESLPHSVTVRDYDPDVPSTNISENAIIDPVSSGTEYIYGENVRVDETRTVSEEAFLAGIREEEASCSKTRFIGKSTEPMLHAGFTFHLYNHPKSIYNSADRGTDYLLTEVRHGFAASDTQQDRYYRNSFSAIESTTQYRPKRVTPKPRFYGTINAFIYEDAGGLVMDPEGRYRVQFPFDNSSDDSKDPGRDHSAWIRRATPYAGQDEGMYFPLKGGTEVLITFINGDPDQPVISAAVPNYQQSLINGTNPEDSIIRTKDNNRILLKDHTNTAQERILIETPEKNTSIRMGSAPSGERDGLITKTDGDHIANTKGSYIVHAENDKGDYTWDWSTTVVPIPPPPPPAGKLKLEMNDNKMLIDTGGRDLEINCKHFNLNNYTETNTTKGLDTAIHRGNCDEQFYGNKTEYFDGTLTATFVGSTVESYYGHKFEWTLAATESFAVSNAVEVFGGLKEEFALTGTIGLTIGGAIDIFAGLKEEIALIQALDIFVGLKTEVMLGADTGFQLAGFLKYTGGAGIDFTSAKIIQDKAGVEQRLADLKDKTLEVMNSKSSLKKIGFGLENAVLKAFL